MSNESPKKVSGGHRHGTILCVNLCAFVYGCSDGNGLRRRPTGGVGVAMAGERGDRRRSNERTPIGHRGRDLICARARGQIMRSSIAVRPGPTPNVFGKGIARREVAREREIGNNSALKTRGRGGRLQITASTLPACLRDQSLKLETIMSICHSDDDDGSGRETEQSERPERL